MAEMPAATSWARMSASMSSAAQKSWKVQVVSVLLTPAGKGCQNAHTACLGWIPCCTAYSLICRMYARPSAPQACIRHMAATGKLSPG